MSKVLQWVSAIGLATILGGCQPGSSGPLEPVGNPSGDSVAPGGGKSIQISTETLLARVSGSWASEGEQTLDVRYANNGKLPLSLDCAGFAMRRDRDRTMLLSVLDMTDVNMRDRNPDNDTPTELFNSEKKDVKSVVTLVPGSERILQVNFSNVMLGSRIGPDQKLTANIPTADKLTSIDFRAVKAGWF